LSKLVDEFQRYRRLKHLHFQNTVYSIIEKTISQVHVSQGSADTLVRKGGIINKFLIVYSLSNISAKNYCNRLMRVEVIVCNISVIFLRWTEYSFSQCMYLEKRFQLGPVEFHQWLPLFMETKTGIVSLSLVFMSVFFIHRESILLSTIMKRIYPDCIRVIQKDHSLC